jgi:hypothetical protein
MSYLDDEDDDGCCEVSCDAIEYVCICGPFWDCVLDEDDYDDDNSTLIGPRVKDKWREWKKKREAARQRRLEERRQEEEDDESLLICDANCH